jgi:uncharacterized membrane protein YfcA
MEYQILFGAGIIVGIIGVIFGGSMFLSIPIFQQLFPGMAYGHIVGNIKVGSLSRGIASSLKTWKKINPKDALSIAIPFIVASIIGTATIAKLDQSFLIYGVITAILFSEISPHISHLVNKRSRILFSVIAGLYNGLIGAGIGILLVAILRTIFPKNEEIIFVKIQARFIEMLAGITVVIAHIYYGNILFPVWLVWALGSLIGGIVGGSILKKTINIKPNIQRAYLITVYIIALLPFAIKHLHLS